MVSLSLGWAAPLWAWTGAEQLLSYPWQVILLAAPFLVALAGSLPALHREFATPVMWATLVTLVILGSYGDLTTQFTQVRPPAAPVAIFGEQQNLVILSAKVTEHDGPSQAELQVVWQVLRPLDFDYNIFFHALTGSDDNPAIEDQTDLPPLENGPPATQWRPGEIFSATYQLNVPPQPTGANLRYIFGFYDWRDGQRLPVDGGIADKLVLYGK
jgi:hypothetical protein